MDILIVLLTVVGTAFCVTEAFTYGFGFFGISGAISVGLSLIISIIYYDISIYTVITIQLVLICIVSFAIYMLFKNTTLKEKLILKDTLDECYDKFDKKQYINQIGTSLTPLKPVGNISIDNDVIEVLSMGEYINKGKKVKVKKIVDNKIFVEELYEEAKI